MQFNDYISISILYISKSIVNKQKVCLAVFPELPASFKGLLLLGATTESKYFLKNVREYNSAI